MTKEQIESEIKILNNSIEMLLKTLREPKTLPESYNAIMDAIVDDKNRLNELKRELIKETNEEYNSLKKEIVLDKGICGQCGKFTIDEPLFRRDFLIDSLSKYGINKTDIVSFEYDSSPILTIAFRDTKNVSLNKLFSKMKKMVGDDTITIDVLDNSLKTVYTITFNECTFCEISGCGGDYRTSEPRIIVLRINYKGISFQYK